LSEYLFQVWFLPQTRCLFFFQPGESRIKESQLPSKAGTLENAKSYSLYGTSPSSSTALGSHYAMLKCPVTYSHFDAFALIGFLPLKIITKLILLLILLLLKINIDNRLRALLFSTQKGAASGLELTGLLSR
jgi:hypothetical protein